MRVNTFDDFIDFIYEWGEEDPAYCNRVAARFIQNNVRAARRNQEAIDIIFRTPKRMPSSDRWRIYVEGLAELLMNMGLKPSYEASWITDDVLEEEWAPGVSRGLDRYKSSTPPEFAKRNLIVGDGIMKAV